MECQPDLSALTRKELQDLMKSANRVEECFRVLERGGLNIVGEILRGQETFYEMNHYPEGDVFDTDTRSQYYYHAHRSDTSEHGHFHTFLRVESDEGKPDRTVHLVAISMDRWGYPTGLFTTNRWVTDELWHSAEQIIPRLGEFEIDHASPSWPVNIWITHLLKLYRLQIAILIAERDRVLKSAMRPLDALFEDRDLEVLSECQIDVAAWKRCIEVALTQRSQAVTANVTSPGRR